MKTLRQIFGPEPSPFAMEWDKWNEFDAKYRQSHPIKFLFYERIPRAWGRLTYYKLDSAYWWFQHRFNPRHRYHMLRVADKPGYAEIDERMLQACFRLLVQFVKCGGIPPSWHEDTDRIEGHTEIIKLYEWWTQIRPKREDRRYIVSQMEELTDEDHRMEDLFEEAAHEEDQINLRRLIDVRPMLWT